ncbi:MAG: FxsC protein [Planctomycetales bacterium]
MTRSRDIRLRAPSNLVGGALIVYPYFLSYSRQDNSPYLKKFFELVDEAVQARLPRSKFPLNQDGHLGFRDADSIPHGAKWSEELATALATCQTMVVLCSTNCFDSPWCGKEWQFFNDRLAANPGLSVAPRVFPVVWVSPTIPTPARVAALQDRLDDYGKDYVEYGLRMLVGRPEMALDIIVAKLAQKIADAALNHPLPDAPLPVFDEVENAFQPPPPPATAPAAAVPPRPVAGASKGPRSAHFVFVAAKKKEFEEAKVNRPTDPYGDSSEDDWQPYFPLPDSVRDVALEAAGGKFYTSPLAFEANLPERIRDAEKLCEIVVLLVDAWTLMLDDYQKVLEEYDTRQYRNTALVVPWNDADPQTQARAAELRDLIDRTFSRQVAPRIRLGITTPGHLKQELAAALEDCRSRILKYLPVRQHPLATGGATALPKVSGSKG